MINNENSKLNALLADDEEHIRKYFTSIIREMGFGDIYHAKNGSEAIECFVEFSPKLTLLDIIMPGKDGIAALKRIREVNSESCIIMLTSVDTEDSIKKCLEYGASNYILKDANHLKVVTIIKDSLCRYSISI